MFHRGFKHSKTIKALGLRHRAFISFLVFETPMKHEARVFETVLKNSPPDLTCYVNCCVISATSFPGSLILPPPRANEGVGLCLILLQVPTGAIIGDGDRKRAPFLVLGLAPWYGTIFLFLEQIAPSPAAHARTLLRGFRGCRAGEMAFEIPEIVYAFGPQLNAFMAVRILLKYFRRNLLQFEWRQCRM